MQVLTLYALGKLDLFSELTYINQSGNFAQISWGGGGVTNPLIGRTQQIY